MDHDMSPILSHGKNSMHYGSPNVIKHARIEITSLLRTRTSSGSRGAEDRPQPLLKLLKKMAAVGPQVSRVLGLPSDKFLDPLLTYIPSRSNTHRADMKV